MFGALIAGIQSKAAMDSGCFRAEIPDIFVTSARFHHWKDPQRAFYHVLFMTGASERALMRRVFEHGGTRASLHAPESTIKVSQNQIRV